MIVCNSTPLIYLAKLGQLELLRGLFGQVRVSEEVWSEVLRGKQLGFADAGVVERAQREGWIKTIRLNERMRREVQKLLEVFTDISAADASTIVLARELRVPAALDDSRAVKVAEALGVKHVGTLGILLLAVKRGLVKKERAKELVLSLPEHGFYVAHDLLAELLKQLE